MEKLASQAVFKPVMEQLCHHTSQEIMLILEQLIFSCFV
jgi:hypothetical protein